MGRHAADTLMDRVHGSYAVGALVALAVVAALRRSFGATIVCKTPSQFTASDDVFANNQCWMKEYFVPNIADDIPTVHQQITQIKAFYQWIPVILLLQAFLFLVPRIIWSLGNLKPGLTTSLIDSAASDYLSAISHDERRDAIMVVSSVISQHLSDNCRKSAAQECSITRIMWTLYGYSLSALYLVVKFLNLINVIGQLFLVTIFLGWKPFFHTDSAYAFKFLKFLFFPDSILCDFELRSLATLHQFTVQCVLPINLFHLTIYVTLWWAFLLLTFATFANFIYWAIRVAFRPGQVGFMKAYLVALGLVPADGHGDRAVADFCSSYFYGDGFLCLKLLQDNAGDIMAAKVLAEVFVRFKKGIPENCNGENVFCDSAL